MNFLNPFVNSSRVKITYRNYKEEIKEYNILPLKFYWGRTEYYPQDCYLLKAYVLDKKVLRIFALSRVILWDDGCIM